MVESGSVLITCIIDAVDLATAEQTTKQLSSDFGTTSTAQSKFAGANLTFSVENVPDVLTEVESTAVASPPPAASGGSDDDLDGGAIAGIVIGSLIGAGLVGAAVAYAMTFAKKSPPEDPAGVAFTPVAISGEADNI